MRKAIFPLVASLLVGGLLFGGSLPRAPIPRKAAEFVIHFPDGKQTLLSSYRGKTVVLSFMFTTCVHCQHLAPILSGIQQGYAEKGVQVLGSTFDQQAASQVKSFDALFAKGFPCGYSSNEEVLRFLQQPATNPPFVPIVIFIDKAGTIRSVHMITGDTPENSPEKEFFQSPEKSIPAELDKILKTPVKAPRS